MATCCVITPTIGRPSLERNLLQSSGLLLPGDSHILAIDTSRVPPDITVALQSLSMVRTVQVSSLRSRFGNAQRDAAISLSLTLSPPPDYLVFCDDDDFLLSPGIDVIHSMPPDNRLHVFPLKGAVDITDISDSPYPFSCGTISGAMLVVPARVGLPRWMDHNVREADFFFANSCRKLFGDPIFHSEPLIEVG